MDGFVVEIRGDSPGHRMAPKAVVLSKPQHMRLYTRTRLESDTPGIKKVTYFWSRAVYLRLGPHFIPGKARVLVGATLDPQGFGGHFFFLEGSPCKSEETFLTHK